MKHLLITLLVCWSGILLQAQTVSGSFPQAKGKEMRLMGYDGFTEKELAHTRCDSTGHFVLSCSSTYTGAALLQLKDASNVIIILNNENFTMQWDNMQDFKTLEFSGSPENEAFANGIILNQEAEQKLAGLKYLLAQYEKQPDQYQWLKNEIAVQEKHFQQYVRSLPASSYAAFYLETRKLVTDMAQAAERYPEQKAQCEEAFKNYAFGEERLWHSGLMSELFAGFYQLMAKYADADKIVAHANPATDAWLKCLAAVPLRQQDVAEYCFKVLEQGNLTGASEYIAKAMLGESGCQLDEKRTLLFEQYRKMLVGNTAPDIALQDGTTLSSVQSKYKLVVFGASWCPDCQRDYPSLVGSYKKLKDKYNIEFVYITLDTDKKVYSEFYKEAPFITSCDTKGWGGAAVKDYCVFATPTYFLLDKDLKIVAKIKSPEELEFFLSTAGNNK